MIQEQTLAEDHPDQLASQHELAIAYQANGQVKEAVLLLEHVIMIQEQTLAKDHLDRLAPDTKSAISTCVTLTKLLEKSVIDFLNLPLFSANVVAKAHGPVSLFADQPNIVTEPLIAFCSWGAGCLRCFAQARAMSLMTPGPVQASTCICPIETRRAKFPILSISMMLTAHHFV